MAKGSRSQQNKAIIGVGQGGQGGGQGPLGVLSRRRQSSTSATRRFKQSLRKQKIALWDVMLRASCIWTSVLGVLLIANTLVTIMAIEQKHSTDAAGKLTTSPSLPYCERLYGNLTTRQENLMIKSEDVVPPLLLSYPGSGNTYLRAVLEYATSLHSG